MAGLIPTSINLVNAGNSPLFPRRSHSGIDQSGESNDFVSILNTTFINLNNDEIEMTPQGSNGKQFNMEAFSEDFKVKSDENTISGEDILDMLKGFILNINTPQVIMANIISNEANGQLQHANIQGNNIFMQLKIMMNHGSEIKSPTGTKTADSAFADIISSGDMKAIDGQATDTIMAKLQKWYFDFGSAVKEATSSMTGTIKAEELKPLFTEFSNQDTSRNSLSTAVSHSIEKSDEAQNAISKEIIHITKIGELGEPIMKTIGAGEKYLIIKLDPPDMGTVQIKLTLQDGELKVDFKVESQSVKEMFSIAMPQIKAALEDAGIKSSNFFVNVRDEFQQQGGREKKQQEENANSKQQQNNNKELKQKFSDFFA